MNINIIVVIALIAVVALFFIVRASGSKPVAEAIEPKRDDITDSAVAAVEDVVGPLVGVDIHPDIPEGPADNLTTLKGLGPKAAAQLNALGITRYAQIAAWSETDIAAIDARMGAFKGRIARDKWVEQAAYLAAEDRSGFEAKFGKLGS
jgi:predicted flap endonuclease-1-like 5' DNA nuclease